MKTNKSLDDLTIFSEVMRCKSYSRAAEVAGVSKSHVSKSVARLEHNLGVHLFERHSRRMSATLVAEELYNQINDNLNHIDRTLNDIRSAQSILKGKLRITTAGEYGETVITQKSIAFMQQYPDVEIDIVFSNEILDLVDNRIDIAIRTGPLPDSDLIARAIAYRRLTVVCSPQYAQTYGLPKSPADLTDHQCLIGSTNQWGFQVDGKHRYFKMYGKWQSNNGNSLTIAATSGLGLAQLPETYTQKHLQNGSLIECLNQYQLAKSPVWAVFQKRSAASAIIRKYIDLLAQEQHQT